jgi:hypothetical protein
MADGDYIRVASDDARHVGDAFPLGKRRIAQVHDGDDPAAEAMHCGLK